jgi:hypothetical protein
VSRRALPTSSADAKRLRRCVPRGVEAVGRALVLLHDASPVQLAVTRGKHTPERITERVAKWGGVRESLILFAAAHTSPAVSEKTYELVEAIWDALTRTAQALGALTPEMVPWLDDPAAVGTGAELDSARRHHARAKQLANDLLILIRNDPVAATAAGDPG